MTMIYRKRNFILKLFRILLVLIIIGRSFGTEWISVFADETSETTMEEITITYNASGNSAYSVSYAINEDIYLEFPTDLGFDPQSGYTFAGWSEIQNDNTILYSANAVVDFMADTTLYAVWKSDSDTAFTATLDGVTLTEGGAISTAWDSAASAKMLNIAVKTLSEGSTLTITLPTGMQLASTNYTPANSKGIDSVNFSILGYEEGMKQYYRTNATDAGTSTTTYSYYNQDLGMYYNASTGTLTYELAAGYSGTISVPVTFDTKIWDDYTTFQDDLTINLTNDDPALTIRLTQGSTVTEKYLSRVIIDNANANKSYATINATMPESIDADSDFPMFYYGTQYTSRYLAQVELTVQLPKDDDGNYAKYLGEVAPENKSFDEDYLDYYGSTTANLRSVFVKYEEKDFNMHIVYDESAGTVTYTLDNWCGQEYIYLMPVITTESTGLVPGDKVTTSITATLTYYNGTMDTTSSATKTLYVSDDGVVTTVAESVTAIDENDTELSYLGSLSFENSGWNDLINTGVEYMFDTTNVKVTNLSIPYPNPSASNDITIDKITFTDGITTYTIENMSLGATNTWYVSTNIFTYNLAIQAVIETYNKSGGNGEALIYEERKYYLESVSYVIDTIEPYTKLYFDSAIRTWGSLGSYYGYVNEGVTSATTTTYSYLAITSGDDITKTQLRNPWYSTANRSEYLMLDYIKVTNQNGITATNSSTTVEAGESIMIETSISMANYPYNLTQYAENPVLYFVAPSGVSINSVTANLTTSSFATSDTSSTTLNLESTHVAKQSLSDGSSLYTITFSDDAYLAGPSVNKEGTILYEPSKLVVTMEVSSAATMNNTTVSLRSSIFASTLDENVTIAGAGSQLNYIISEPVDTNNNGTTEQVVVILNTYATTCLLNITPNTSELTITPLVKNEVDTVYSDFINVSGDENTINYKLTIENLDDNVVIGNSFAYYIPITKIDSTIIYPEESGVILDDFDFSLLQEVEITGENPHLYETTYFVDDFTEEKFLDEDCWILAAEVIDWEDVTFVKVTGKEGTELPANTVDNIILTCNANVDDLNVESAGNIASWKTVIWKAFDENGDSNETWGSSEAMQVQFTYIEKLDVALIAGYVGEDETEEDGKYTVTLTGGIGLTGKNISIQSLVTNNVDLVSFTGVTNEARDLATILDSDTKFGLQIQLNENSSGYILSNSATSIDFGIVSIPDDQMENTFEITLSNYANITDWSTNRTVSITIGDGSSIEYQFMITIERIPRPITNPESTIAGGMIYNVTPVRTVDLTITQDASITAQYAYEYIPQNYDTAKLSFNKSVPVGTTIVFIYYEEDFITPKGYYYYKITSETSSVNLKDLANMYDDTPFSMTISAEKERAVCYEFIIDFANTETLITPGDYTITLETSSSNATIEDASIEELKFSIIEKRSFEYGDLNTTSNYEMNDNNLTISNALLTYVGKSQGADITNLVDGVWQNEILAIKITLDNGEDGENEIPLGTHIEYNGVTYFRTDDCFIIPLEKVESQNISYTIQTEMEQFESDSEQTFKVEVVNYEEPYGAVYASATYNVKINPVLEYAIDLAFVENGTITENQLITAEEATEGFQVQIAVNEDTASTTLSLRVQEKSDSGLYQIIESVTVRDEAIAYSDTLGKFTLTAIGNDIDCKKAYTLTLTGDVEVGDTYRIIVCPSGHLDTYQSYLHFVIIDE